MQTIFYNLFTSKNNSNINISTYELMIKSGLISKLSSGLYIYMPNAIKLIQNIKNIIIEEMNKINMYEFSMPILQPYFLLKNKTKYYNNFIETNIKNKKYVLSPTNEEEFLHIFINILNVKKKLPIKLFQIEKKFRNEIRNLGILRSYEFIMKDGYSIHSNIKCMNNTYFKVYNSYIKIFDKLNIKYCINKGDKEDNYINNILSHEFYSFINNNNTKKNNNLEIAHIFKIGKINLKSNKKLYICSYGIGISRLFYTIINQNIDNNKIILPYILSIFKVSIININNDNNIIKFSYNLYKKLNNINISTILNNNKESYGESINNSEIIGIPIILIVSKKNFINNNIEIRLRIKNKNIIINIKDVINFIINEIKN